MGTKFHLFAAFSLLNFMVLLGGCAATTPSSSVSTPAGPPSVISPHSLADSTSPPESQPNPECAVKEPVPPAAITSKPGYVQVRVSVVDENGQPVRALKQSDFMVSSEGNQLPVIYSHEEKNWIPRSVIITIDTSRSMAPKLDEVRAKIGALVDGLNKCDEVGLIAFSSRPFLLQTLTVDHHLVAHRLKLLHATGPTALYDALDTSAKLLARGRYQDRAVILVTDGMDNVSRTSMNDVVADVTREHVRVYAIRIRETSTSAAKGIIAILTNSDAVDADLFDKISQTGGTSFNVPSVDTDLGREFARAIANVGAALNPGYDVGFTAPSTGASPSLTVSVANHPNYVVQVIKAPRTARDLSPASGPTVRN